MKHYDNDVKKFIKNVVSLVVSALLLVAATIAWFANNGRVNVSEISAHMVPMIQFDYMDHSVGSTYLDYVTSNDTTILKVRERNSSGTLTTDTDVKSYITSLTSWNSSTGTAWNLSGLYPGKYGIYKMEFNSDGSSKQVKIYFNTVTIAAATKSAVSLYFLAQQVTNGSATDLGQPTITTLSDLSAANGVTSAAFTIPASTAGSTVRVYYVVGMPATTGTSSYQHADAVQTDNGSVVITKIAVE